MTRSSVVAAVVVTVLLALLIWWRDEHSGTERSTQALNPLARTTARTSGVVAAVPTARAVSPSVDLPPLLEAGSRGATRTAPYAAYDAGATASPSPR